MIKRNGKNYRFINPHLAYGMSETNLLACLKISHFKQIFLGKGPLSHRRSFIHSGGGVTPRQDGGIVDACLEAECDI